MATTQNASSKTTVDRLGGEPVIIRVNWTTAEQESQSYFAPTDLFQMVVRKESTDSPGTYVDIGESGAPLYCYSGVPQQGTTLYHYDPQPSRILAYTSVQPDPLIDRFINAPNFQFVKGSLPKTLAGIYHIQLQRKAIGDPAFSDFGDPVTMWCQEPTRFDTIYSLKQNYDEEPYLVGHQSIESGGV